MIVSLLLVHAAATWFMTGLIWFVQVVHYPLFQKVGVDAFKDYEHAHQRRTTLVVAPVMLIEAATATLLVTPLAATTSPWWSWLGMALLTLIWLSTFFVQVPLHAALEATGSREAMVRLVRSNWIRTVAWTLRSCVAGVLILRTD